MNRKKSAVTIACVLIAAVSFILSSCSYAPVPRCEFLPAPQNLRVKKSMLLWDEVPNAVGYAVYIENDEYETHETRLNLTEITESGVTYELCVIALGDGYKYSNSEEVKIDYFNPPPVEEPAPPAPIPKQEFSYKLLDDGSGYEISCGNVKLEGRVVIPESYHGLPVKKIADYGFEFCGFTEIFIPDSVTILGDYAMWFCPNLTEIRFPANIEHIGYDAFIFSKWLDDQPDGIVEANGFLIFFKGSLPEGTQYTLPPSIKHIVGDAFSELSAKSVTLIVPDGVTIDKRAFQYYQGKAVRLPSDLTKIPDYAFSISRLLESVVIPDRVTEIGKKAFLGCDILQSVELPDNLQKIGDDAFAGCYKLKMLRIPESVTELGIMGYSGIHELIISPTLAASNIQFSTPYDINMYVTCSPEECEYDFDNIYNDECLTFYLYVENEADLPDDGGNYWHYDTDGKTPLVWA